MNSTLVADDAFHHPATRRLSAAGATATARATRDGTRLHLYGFTTSRRLVALSNGRRWNSLAGRHFPRLRVPLYQPGPFGARRLRILNITGDVRLHIKALTYTKII